MFKVGGYLFKGGAFVWQSRVYVHKTFKVRRCSIYHVLLYLGIVSIHMVPLSRRGKGEELQV
jgi:hypothetical protein